MRCAPQIVIGVSLVFLTVCCSMQGHVSFFQPPTYSGNGPLFVADFNGDGKPDILTGDGTMNLGNGDGTFTPGTTVSGGVLAVADFNGDGNPDVLQQGTGTLLVLLGKGDGTFQAPTSSSSGVPSLLTVAAADLNGDGSADVVGVFGTSVLVFLSKGGGTFGAGVSYNLGTTSAGSTLLLLADFNGDGKTDIGVSLAGNNVAGQELFFLGNGDGTFQAPKSSTTVYNPQYIAAGDFNGDGKLDLAISAPAFCNGTCTQAESLFILAGNGDGTFQSPVAALTGNGPIAVGDLNGDGKLDLAFTGNDPTVAQVYLGNGDGTFSNRSNYVIAFPPGPPFIPIVAPITIADFNMDGKPDIVALSDILLGNGDGSFAGVPLGLVPDSLMNDSAAVAISDFESNGKLDVAVVPYPNLDAPSPSNLYILRNNGSGVLTLIHTYALFQPSYRVFAADLNGDGKPDLVVSGKDASTGNWSYTVLLGNGDGGFQAPILYQQSVNGSLAAIGDFNDDHKPDLAAVAGSSAAVFLSNGDGTFSAPIYALDGSAYSLLIGDFNGDGKLDLAAPFMTGTTGATGILYGNGNGSFQPEAFPSSLNSFSAAYVGDFNNDGRPDLLGSSQNGQFVSINNGDGTFTALSPLPSALRTNGVADLNGDGNLDLSIVDDFTSQDQFSGVVLGNGDGTFGSFQNLNVGLVAAAFFADMNNDGLPDMVFPRALGVGVLLNTTQKGAPQPDFRVVASWLSPAPVVHGNSATSTIAVTSLNGFIGNVTLSCSGLPAGASCTFNPASISCGSGSSTMTVSTTSGLAAGTYSFTVNAVSGTTSHIAALSLNVASTTPDFQISAAALSPATVGPGASATSTLSVAALNGFSSAVALSCDSAISGVTCNPNPASVTPSGGTDATSALTVNVASTVTPGTYSIHISGTSGTTVHSTGLLLIVAKDFSVGPAPGSPTSQTISAGQTASFSLVFSSLALFSGTVNLSCAITPVVSPAPTCSLSSAAVNLTGSETQTVTVSVKTTSSSNASLSLPDFRLPWTMMPWILIMGLGGLMMLNRRRETFVARACVAPILILVLGALMSCGENSTSTTTHGTPSGTYTATVTATSGTLNHNTALQVVVQ